MGIKGKSFIKRSIKVAKKMYRNNTKIVLVVVLCISLLSCFIVSAETYRTKSPYAIRLDGDYLCSVKSKDDANKVMDRIVSKYIKAGTTVRAVDTGGRLVINRARKDEYTTDSIFSVNEAVSSIKDYIDKENKNPLEIKIVSSGEEVAEYTPEPNYIKEEKELAGHTRIDSKGENGKRQYFVMYTTVNGKVESKQSTAGRIIEEGVPADVAKGVLGLPEGADWKTYTGEPVFNDGEDVSITGQQYIGKVRYRLGGSSLTTGVDCIGFVRAIYRLYGINLPSTLGKVGTHVSYSNAKPGDIIIYSSHAGIYIGNGKIVHATSGKGVSISNANGISKPIKDVRRVK